MNTNIATCMPTYIGWLRLRGQRWTQAEGEHETEHEAWQAILPLRADEKCVLPEGQRPSQRVFRGR